MFWRIGAFFTSWIFDQPLCRHPKCWRAQSGSRHYCDKHLVEMLREDGSPV